MSEQTAAKVLTEGEGEQEVMPTDLITFVGEGFTLTGRLFRNGIQMFGPGMPSSIPMISPQMGDGERDDALRETQAAVGSMAGIDVSVEEVEPRR